jgi:YHS domain-containing protein
LAVPARATAEKEGITVELNIRTEGFLSALFILCLFFSCAKTPPVTQVNMTPEGVAIKGYDPVAYFTDRRPVKGMPEFEYEWRGARWRFATTAHRDEFQRDPERYAPRYGGYCAYAVSQRTTADIDPESWTIFGGRLYLNLNKDVQRLWEKNMQDYIRRADENWPRISKKRK